MTTRFRSENVTVTLDDGLARFVRGLMSAAERESVAVLEAEAGQLAAEARTEWYGPHGVDRETGKSGDIRVVTTIDNTKGVVRVSVGSTDDRRAGKTNKPVAVFVHRPRRLGTVTQACSRTEWYAAPENRRGPIFRGDEIYKPTRGVHVPESALRYTLVVANPRAGDGKYLLAELVRKPGKLLVKRVSAKLAGRIVAGAGR